MSRKRNGVSSTWRRLFVQQLIRANNKENTKFPNYWTYVKEINSLYLVYFHKRTSNAENVSLSWLRH